VLKEKPIDLFVTDAMDAKRVKSYEGDQFARGRVGIQEVRYSGK
jgi:hypothetical protein